MTNIVAFYRQESPDYLGRWLSEMWRWNFDKLESAHDYIQVLFPNRAPSMFNRYAPLLDDQTERQFRDDANLRVNLLHSFRLILSFYGFEYQEATGKVVRGPNFRARTHNWAQPYNHNLLRITRILKCLVALGLPEQARAFHAALCEMKPEFGPAIGMDTFSYWDEALPRDK